MLSFLNKILGVKDFSLEASRDETFHINQEVYKKNVELSERNKTLLLLRKIDEIIISSVTDQTEIARKVTYLLVEEAEFELSCIFKYDKIFKVLRRISMHESHAMFEASVKNAVEQLYAVDIPVLESENIIAQSALEKKIKSSNSLKNSLLANVSSRLASNEKSFTPSILFRKDSIFLS